MSPESVTACPCQSGKGFPACCGRFLMQGQLARTPEQLMRSRFSAFALGGFGAYLLATWAPESAAGMTAESLSEPSLDWCGLEIVSKSQQGNTGVVEFRAFFREDGEVGCHHEISQFERRDGRWLYVSGDVSAD